MISAAGADVSCCGKRLAPLQPSAENGENTLGVVKNDGEWHVTSKHVMSREHYISYVVFLTGDTAVVKKMYPEWEVDARLSFFPRGTLLWYCTRDGLFAKQIGTK